MTEPIEPAQNCVVIVMGVSGVGKTTIARALAARLNVRFIEADDYHSGENRAAMKQGIALSDDMRLPWLLSLSKAAEAARVEGHVVMACSALKRHYRDLFRAHIGRVQFVYLHTRRDIIAQRIVDRADHFMPVSLLDTQIATLEPPTLDEGVIVIDVSAPKTKVEDTVEASVRSVFC